MNNAKETLPPPSTPQKEAAVHFTRLPTTTAKEEVGLPDLYVTPTPTGWLIQTRKGGLAYVPDKGHKWGAK